MLYKLLLYFTQFLAFLSAAGSTLPLLIALGLIIGRRGHAAFCLAGSVRISELALGLALGGFFYFPCNYLTVVLPYGLQKSIFTSLFLLEGRPWLSASLCWLTGIIILFLALNVLKRLKPNKNEDIYSFRVIRSSFLLYTCASLLFMGATVLTNWPFAGLPQGMSLEQAGIAIFQHSLRRFFMAFSPAGALSLLYTAYLLRLSHCSQEEEKGALRWFAFWACAGALPALFISWSLQMSVWAQGNAALSVLPRATWLICGLLFQSAAVALWGWLIYRPLAKGWRISLALILTLLKEFWPLLLRS